MAKYFKINVAIWSHWKPPFNLPTSCNGPNVRILELSLSKEHSLYGEVSAKGKLSLYPCDQYFKDSTIVIYNSRVVYKIVYKIGHWSPA